MAALLLGACGGDGEAAEGPAESPTPEALTVNGSIALTAYGSWIGNGDGSGSCGGVDGYGDISGGAVVIVRNATGEQVGLGELEEGQRSRGDCVFDFEVTDIADDSERFTVEVSGRGQVPFTRDEASRLRLSLG